MDFRRGTAREEPEMNLVPLIDVMMVILIFLMVTTTYSRYSELQIDLPTADAPQAARRVGRDQGGGWFRIRARRGPRHTCSSEDWSRVWSVPPYQWLHGVTLPSGARSRLTNGAWQNGRTPAASIRSSAPGVRAAS